MLCLDYVAISPSIYFDVIEILILFLAIVLNLYFNGKLIMDQNQTWNLHSHAAFSKFLGQNDKLFSNSFYSIEINCIYLVSSNSYL